MQSCQPNFRAFLGTLLSLTTAFMQADFVHLLQRVDIQPYNRNCCQDIFPLGNNQLYQLMTGFGMAISFHVEMTENSVVLLCNIRRDDPRSRTDTMKPLCYLKDPNNISSLTPYFAVVNILRKDELTFQKLQRKVQQRNEEHISQNKS